MCVIIISIIQYRYNHADTGNAMDHHTALLPGRSYIHNGQCECRGSIAVMMVEFSILTPNPPRFIPFFLLGLKEKNSSNNNTFLRNKPGDSESIQASIYLINKLRKRGKFLSAKSRFPNLDFAVKTWFAISMSNHNFGWVQAIVIALSWDGMLCWSGVVSCGVWCYMKWVIIW